LRNRAEFNALRQLVRDVLHAVNGDIHAPGQKGIGLGGWKQDAPGRYNANTTTLIFFDTAAHLPVTPGFLEGAQTVSQRIDLVDANAFNAVASSQFFDTAARSYRSGCATAVGRRFQ